MIATMHKSAASHYAQTSVYAGVEAASPHRLIQMLLEGALGKIAIARSAMQRRDIEAKGSNISLAVSIIQGLDSSLDMESGGELAFNLASLYDYATRRLMEAHATNNEAMLDEVAQLLGEIKAGWDAIPMEERR